MSRAVAVPIMLYNIPGNAVNALTPRAGRAASPSSTRSSPSRRAPATGTTTTPRLSPCSDRLRVFCGPSSVFGVPAVLLGADGTIDCFPNMWAPAASTSTTRRATATRAKRAELQEIGRKLTDLFTIGGRTLYPATKAAMECWACPAAASRARRSGRSAASRSPASQRA